MPPSTPTSSIPALQQHIWAGSLPLEVRLAASDSRTYDQTDPYLVSLLCMLPPIANQPFRFNSLTCGQINVPRLSYLPFLLPRLHAFFASSLIDPSISPHDAWVSFEELPLKWHYPVGLLYDLFSGAAPADVSPDAERATSSLQQEVHAAGDSKGQSEERLPWKLTIHYTGFPVESLFQIDSEGKVLLDAYINSVKEADFIRNGTAKTVMSLSKSDSSALWQSVETHDLILYNSINNKLLNPPGSAIRHIPIKVYLPTTSSSVPTPAPASPQPDDAAPEVPGSIRVVQGLVAPMSLSRQPVTLGTALNGLLPTVFPSRRNPVLAVPVLHGAIVPMNAPVQDLGRAASYTDGFLHVAVVLLG